MSWLALDIGGANLKLADGLGWGKSTPFALWKSPERLAEELQKLLVDAPAAQRIAVTMTGELVDCFPSKTVGVRHILAAVEQATASFERWVYLVDGRLVTAEVALQSPLLAAASNWHALARFTGRFASSAKTALLVDIGSTTCDIIPLACGLPVARGTTDTTRMMAGELLYTGVERSPCCAVKEAITYRSCQMPLAQEWFATMQDVYVMLQLLPEDVEDCGTADGRPSTMENAVRRLGKLVCADELEFSASDAVACARELADYQAQRLANAISQVLHGGQLEKPPTVLLLSGHGEFLARAAIAKLGLSQPIISLTQQLGPNISRCAPAHALAVLAREANL